MNEEKRIEWNEEKNNLLRETRGISFEMFIDDIKNRNYIVRRNENYPNQKKFIIVKNNYPYCIPYVEDGEKIFLKTIFPNRKLKKEFNL